MNLGKLILPLWEISLKKIYLFLFPLQFRILLMIFFFNQLILYYYWLYLLMELFFRLDVLFESMFDWKKFEIFTCWFSRQKDVLNTREKKMFIAFKHHLETNVDVKQVNWSRLSFIHNRLFILEKSLWIIFVWSNWLNNDTNIFIIILSIYFSFVHMNLNQ